LLSLWPLLVLCWQRKTMLLPLHWRMLLYPQQLKGYASSALVTFLIVVIVVKS